MEQQPSFVAQRKSRQVCRLKSSLYWLKQSPRHALRDFLQLFRSLDFVVLKKIILFSFSFIKKKNLLLVYVDDVVTSGDDARWIGELKLYQHKKFQTKDLVHL